MTVSITAAKWTLRKEMKKILSSLTTEEKRNQSQQIANKVLSLPEYKRSQRIAVYLNLPDEVHTFDIVHNILTTDRKCFVPRFDAKSSFMNMVQVHSLDDVQNLPIAKYNVRQPADNDTRDDALATGGLDLVIVPGLAFTPDGYRLGRGKGYYDTYLRRCGPVFTVALAFQQQILNKLPLDSHDQRISVVIHP